MRYVRVSLVVCLLCAFVISGTGCSVSVMGVGADVEFPSIDHTLMCETDNYFLLEGDHIFYESDWVGFSPDERIVLLQDKNTKRVQEFTRRKAGAGDVRIARIPDAYHRFSIYSQWKSGKVPSLESARFNKRDIWLHRAAFEAVPPYEQEFILALLKDTVESMPFVEVQYRDEAEYQSHIADFEIHLVKIDGSVTKESGSCIGLSDEKIPDWVYEYYEREVKKHILIGRLFADAYSTHLALQEELQRAGKVDQVAAMRSLANKHAATISLYRAPGPFGMKKLALALHPRTPNHYGGFHFVDRAQFAVGRGPKFAPVPLEQVLANNVVLHGSVEPLALDDGALALRMHAEPGPVAVALPQGTIRCETEEPTWLLPEMPCYFISNEAVLRVWWTVDVDSGALVHVRANSWLEPTK